MSAVESEVCFPVRRLDLQGALEAGAALSALPRADCYVVDFDPLEWVEPFGMLYFARQLRAFADSVKPARCRAVHHEKHGYAAHMSFFQSFGLSFGNNVGQGAGNDRYIPITCLKIRDLHIEACQNGVDVREVLEARASRMAKVLAHGESGQVQQTLTYSLREILRNVIEHANADHIWYCAQYWPTKRLVELSILDEGKGIAAALSRNPHLSISSDIEALRLSLLPGISGVAFEGQKHVRNDHWANSGYGLFMTSQLCARGGSFLLCSGDTALLIEGEKEVIRPSRFGGTAIRMGLYVPEIRGLSEALHELNKKGKEIAGDLSYPANLTASKSSQMIFK